MFNHFVSNKLFTSSQFGFLPGDSCIAQLLSIIHEIQTSFDRDLRDRNQRVVLNGQNSDWRKVNSGVPQGSVLGPLLFLIYINDLPDGIMSICKIFADDTSLFSKIIDTRNSQNTLNSDLEIIKNWAYQWKMQFKPDPKKQANEVIFSWKSNRCTYPPVTFNNNIIATCHHQKHLGVVLDSKLDFSIDIEQKISKYNKIIGLITRLSVCLPRKALLTIYKFFVRLHLDFGDILYDKPGNLNLQSKIDKVQYKA